MSELRLKSSLEKMTIDIVKYLETKTGVCQVTNEVKSPAERAAVLMWEQKHSLLLPDDLKDFYFTSNGFHLTWSVEMEKNTVPVGHMHINTVASLLRIDSGSKEGSHVQPSLWDMDMDDEDLPGGRKAPSFCDSRVFELDPCDGFGKVCLVYNETITGMSDVDSDSEAEDTEFHFDLAKDYATEIWFLDRSLHWHYICDSFLAYYRLMLMHLGLPHWHLSITDFGLPPHSEQWFNMYAPIRLEVDLEGVVDHTAHHNTTIKVSSSPLDINKVFKGKSDRKRAQGAQNQSAQSGTSQARRKPPVSSARSATYLGKPTHAPNSHVALKTSR